jgi:hypothetical protein
VCVCVYVQGEELPAFCSDLRSLPLLCSSRVSDGQRRTAAAGKPVAVERTGERQGIAYAPCCIHRAWRTSPHRPRRCPTDRDTNRRLPPLPRLRLAFHRRHRTFNSTMHLTVLPATCRLFLAVRLPLNTLLLPVPRAIRATRVPAANRSGNGRCNANATFTNNSNNTMHHRRII